MLSRRDVLALPAVGFLAANFCCRSASAADVRLGAPKTLNDYFPFVVPKSKEAWEARRKQLREQLLVATGLWPMPEKTPLNATVHGKIDKGEYTIEKVYFASSPG